jgi:hypothetical protein
LTLKALSPDVSTVFWCGERRTNSLRTALWACLLLSRKDAIAQAKKLASPAGVSAAAPNLKALRGQVPLREIASAIDQTMRFR